jgi:hypothetical protein
MVEVNAAIQFSAFGTNNGTVTISGLTAPTPIGGGQVSAWVQNFGSTLISPTVTVSSGSTNMSIYLGAGQLSQLAASAFTNSSAIQFNLWYPWR